MYSDWLRYVVDEESDFGNLIHVVQAAFFRLRLWILDSKTYVLTIELV